MSTEPEVIRQMIKASKERLAGLLEEAALEERYLKGLQAKLAATQARASPLAGRVREQSLTGWVVKAFQHHGGDLRAKQIVSLLDGMGVRTSAKCGMLMNVNSKLSHRKDLFERVESGLYRLKNQPQRRPRR